MMASVISSLAQLGRRGAINSVIGFEAESEGVIVGRVTNLLQDKYGRLEGIEIEMEREPSTTVVAIPYAKVGGVDESRKVVLLRL